jgi:hypothetical protein
MAAAPKVGHLVRRAALVLLVLVLPVAPAASRAASYFVTVAGLGGDPDYEQRFEQWAGELDRVLKGAATDAQVVTLSGKQATRTQLTAALQRVAAEAQPDDDFILMLIGHGSYDGVQYKLNLVGPDISAAELAALCDRIPARTQLIVNTTSASGGSISALAGHGRAVIAATKSGTEKNATVFARYWLEALQDPGADLDKNETISALEAFEYAARKTAGFYESQKRLATEHAVFVDREHGPPVRAPSAQTGAGATLARLTLIRLGSSRSAASDPTKRGLLAQKDKLEQRIDALKYQRAALSPQDYKRQLTEALVELAKVQEALEQ